MLVKFSFFLIAVLVGISAAPYSEIEELENLVKSRMEKLEQLYKNIKNATNFYDEMTLERIDSLNHLHKTISEALEATAKEAVFKAINSHESFSNFECVSREVDVAVSNIKKAYESFPVSTDDLKNASFIEVEPFLTIVENLMNFAHELLETKRKEINQTNDINLKKKILREVAEILQYIDGVIAELEKRAFKVKYDFFEKFVFLCFTTENSFKKTQRENFPRILRCV